MRPPLRSGISKVSDLHSISTMREDRHCVPVDGDYEKIVEGLVGLQTRFFRYACDNNPSAIEEDPEKSIVTSNYVALVFQDTARIMDTIPHSAGITQRFNSHLESIAKEIRRHRDAGGGDYLFWTASLYIWLLIHSCGKDRYDITW